MSTKTNTRETVVGVFSDRVQAEKAVTELRKAGFSDSQIGVVTDKHDHHTTGTTAGKDNSTTSKLVQGAEIGAATGAGVGALWALGIAAAIFPPLGVVAGGTLMAVLASAGIGAAAVSIAGALINLGLSEHEAAYYESELKAGRTLVTVKAGSRYSEASAVLRRYGAYDMETRDQATSTHSASTAASASAAGNQKIELHEEHLHASKAPVQVGEVRVHKEVHTEQKTINVPVQREEIVIERRPVSGAASSSEIKGGQEIRIPVSEEKVTVHKDTVVKEEVSVGKRKVAETETVTGTVRKEELKVEQEGKVDVKTKSKS